MTKQRVYLMCPENIAGKENVTKFIKNNVIWNNYKLTDRLKDADKIILLPSSDGSINADDGKKIEHSLEKDMVVYLINPGTFSVRMVRSIRDLQVPLTALILTPEETEERRQKIGHKKESYPVLIRMQMK